jgi:hypothetical protein
MKGVYTVYTDAEKANLVRKVDARRASGETMKVACERVGISKSSYMRWHPEGAVPEQEPAAVRRGKPDVAFLDFRGKNGHHAPAAPARVPPLAESGDAGDRLRRVTMERDILRAMLVEVLLGRTTPAQALGQLIDAQLDGVIGRSTRQKPILPPNGD